MSLSRRPGPSRRTRVREFAWSGAPRIRDREDRLVTEEPLEVRCAWPGEPARRVAVTMRTPGQDFELAAGLLATEGILAGSEHLQTVAYCTDQTLLPEQEFNVVTVSLTTAPEREPALRYDGPAAATSACGVCGAQSIDDVLHRLPPEPEPESRAVGLATPAPPVQAEVLRQLPGRLRAAQQVFDRTGALHAAGLFGTDGELQVVREDVGRHNAVDKVVGARLLGGPAAPGGILTVSGRIGFEIAHKAAMAGVRVLAAVGAPSSLAVDLAERSGLCLVGFLRADRFVVYTSPETLEA